MGKVFVRQVGTVGNMPATKMETFLKKGVLDWKRQALEEFRKNLK